ncbi:sugar ABC transporter permease, partial [Enterococcus faecalis]
MAKAKCYHKKQRTALTSVYIIFTILAVFWMFPIVWFIFTSFRGEGGAFVTNIIPKTFTLEKY